MRKITITIGITAVAMFMGLAACSSDSDTGGGSAGSGGSGNTGNTGNPTSTGTDTGGGSSSGGGSSTGGSSTGGTGGGTAELAHCGQTCSAAVDCCPAQATGCPDMGMTQYECDTGECKFTGCQVDGDCSLIPNYKCFQEGSGEYTYGSCGMPCTADADCVALSMKCLADVDGDMYCKTEPTQTMGCKMDTDCGGNGICDVPSGACTCNADTDCKLPGFDHCFM